jgi:hypothetical protein
MVRIGITEVPRDTPKLTCNHAVQPVDVGAHSCTVVYRAITQDPSLEEDSIDFRDPILVAKSKARDTIAPGLGAPGRNKGLGFYSRPLVLRHFTKN